MGFIDTTTNALLVAGMTVTEAALCDPAAAARDIRPLLGKHPIRQSDPRTRGLVFDMMCGPSTAHTAARLPTPLWKLFRALARNPAARHILAVNEMPPTCVGWFGMLPHLDRSGARSTLPYTTTVCFLEFPSDGRGGELAVFPRASTAVCGLIRTRENAYEACERAGATLIAPVPGRACHLAGDLPHAVLGYTTQTADRRLVAVLAELIDP